MKTDYLILIDSSNHFVESKRGFKSLFMANENNSVSNNKIKFKNNSFKYKIQTNRIGESSINSSFYNK